MEDLTNELQSKIERLESEISFKNGLISVLSHDSKSMFSNLLWLIDAVEQNTLSEEEFFKLLPQVKADAQKNLQTVQDSTAWLNTQYGEFKIKPEKIPVYDLFLNLREKYAAELQEKRLNFHYSGDPAASVETDRMLIQYVLDKIVHNAIKFSHPGGDICLHTITAGSNDQLSITDTGTGMDEGQLTTMYSFENPIYRGTAGETGAGLSLKIVKNFVSLLKGSIKIISSVNKGSTVSVSLPKSEK